MSSVAFKIQSSKFELLSPRAALQDREAEHTAGPVEMTPVKDAKNVYALSSSAHRRMAVRTVLSCCENDNKVGKKQRTKKDQDALICPC